MKLDRSTRNGLLSLCVLLAFSIGVARAETGRPIADGAPRIGLVLSGGGARGAAHVGVIKVLEEMRVPIHYVAGTSMGAIVGGLYASGMSADQIAVAVNEMDWNRMFQDDQDRADRSFRRKRDDDLLLVKARPGFDIRAREFKFPLGLVEGQQIGLALKELTLPVAEIEDFDRLPIPFRAVATDIGVGTTAVLSSGDLAQAIGASMAVPGVFAPTLVDGRLLVDGGITNNLPMDVAREMGADVLIVVDISTPLHPPEEITDVLILTDQLTSIMTRANTERNLATLTESDIAIVPELGEIKGSDFDRAEEAVEIGYLAADRLRNRFSRYAVTEVEYRMWESDRASRVTLPPVVNFIAVQTDAELDPRILREKIEHPVGERLQAGQMERDMNTIYGMALFERVGYQVIERDGQTGVVVDARAKRWGPDYLQFGLDLEDDFEGNTLFNLRVAYLQTAMNDWGAEWRTELTVGEDPGVVSEWYQPLGQDQLYFVNPIVFWGKRNVNVFDDGKKISEYQLTEYGLRFDAGRELSNWGEIRTGIERSEVTSSLQVGEPSGIETAYSQGRAFLRFEVDRLDDVNFPTSGRFIVVNYDWHREFFGDDSDYQQLTYAAGVAMSSDRYTLFPSISGGNTVSGDTPISGLFQLGGFLRLSGIEADRLSGEEFLLGRLVGYRRVNDFEFMPVYVGASLEYGSIGDDADLGEGIAAGSLFLGVDSFLGPAYLGLGLAEGGESTAFMFLGRRF
jgi:NTE family protein